MTIPTLLAPLNGSLAAQDRAGALTLTATGALRYVAGHWAGTQAAFVEEATTNLVLNPRFVSGARWTAGSSTLVQDTAVTEDGVPSAKVTITTVSGSTPYLLMADYPAVAPGEQLAFSCRMRGSRTGLRTGWQVTWRDASGTAIGAAIIAPSLTTTTAWQTMTWVSPVAPANTASSQILIRMELGSPTLAIGDIFWYCKPQVEKKTYATSYCDGSLGTGYSWSGTANASSSTRASASISIPNANHLTTGSFSVAFWLNNIGRGQQDSQPVWWANSSGNWPAGPVVRCYADGRLNIAPYGNNAGGAYTAGPVTTNQWHLIVMTYRYASNTDSTWVSYLDNVLVGQRDNYIYGSGPPRILDVYSQFRGYGGFVVGPLFYFDRVLTASERTTLYQDTQPWTWGTLAPAFGGLVVSTPPQPMWATLTVPPDPLAAAVTTPPEPLAVGVTSPAEPLAVAVTAPDLLGETS